MLARRLVSFVAAPPMISLDRVNEAQEIQIEISARIIQSAEVKSADRVEPVGLGEPVPEAGLFGAATYRDGAGGRREPVCQ
jgi:hypothetical protein